VTGREFNFGVADAGRSGPTFVFQWREESGPRHQLSLDLGLADSDRRRTGLVLFGGGQYAFQMARSSSEVPLDFLFTLGAHLAVGDLTLFRVPVGLSIGHRFGLEGNLALTPYVHPRLSLDICNNCGGNSDLAASFDLGANFEITRTMAIRVSALFTGSDSFDEDGFGVSLAWTPPGLARRR
jgi:hypothetical protein